MLGKYCTQYASKFANLAVATGLEKVSFHSNPKERHAKECSNYRTIALISHASNVMLKILQAMLQFKILHWPPAALKLRTLLHWLLSSTSVGFCMSLSYHSSSF